MSKLPTRKLQNFQFVINKVLVGQMVCYRKLIERKVKHRILFQGSLPDVGAGHYLYRVTIIPSSCCMLFVSAP